MSKNLENQQYRFIPNTSSTTNPFNTCPLTMMAQICGQIGAVNPQRMRSMKPTTTTYSNHSALKYSWIQNLNTNVPPKPVWLNYRLNENTLVSSLHINRPVCSSSENSGGHHNHGIKRKAVASPHDGTSVSHPRTLASVSSSSVATASSLSLASTPSSLVMSATSASACEAVIDLSIKRKTRSRQKTMPNVTVAKPVCPPLPLSEHSSPYEPNGLASNQNAQMPIAPWLLPAVATIPRMPAKSSWTTVTDPRMSAKTSWTTATAPIMSAKTSWTAATVPIMPAEMPQVAVTVPQMPAKTSRAATTIQWMPTEMSWTTATVPRMPGEMSWATATVPRMPGEMSWATTTVPRMPGEMSWTTSIVPRMPAEMSRAAFINPRMTAEMSWGGAIIPRMPAQMSRAAFINPRMPAETSRAVFTVPRMPATAPMAMPVSQFSLPDSQSHPKMAAASRCSPNCFNCNFLQYPRSQVTPGSIPDRFEPPRPVAHPSLSWITPGANGGNISAPAMYAGARQILPTMVDPFLAYNNHASRPLFRHPWPVPYATPPSMIPLLPNSAFKPNAHMARQHLMQLSSRANTFAPNGSY